MNRLNRWVICALLVASVAGPTRAAAESEIRVILNRPVLQGGLAHDREMLWTVALAELGQAEGLVFVDRASFQQALDEMALGEMNLTEPAGAARFGRFLGANFMVNVRCGQVGEASLVTLQAIDIETSRVYSAYETVAESDLPSLAKTISMLTQKTLQNVAPRPAETVAETRIELDPDAPRPRLAVWIPEEHVPQVNQRIEVLIDPAAETELVKRLIDAGFPVLDLAFRAAMAREPGEPLEIAAAMAREKDLDYLVYGEALSELGDRVGAFVGTRARVEIKAVDVRTGHIVFSDSAYGGATDLAESTSGKKALQQAADRLADILLPRLLELYAASN